MRIHNLYVDAEGESHFRDIEVEWAEDAWGGKMTAARPATGLMFRRTEGDHHWHPPGTDWHSATRRQYIVFLDAGVDITASDGEVRRIEVGEVLFVEDTQGKGHLTKGPNGQALQLRHTLHIPID